MPKKIFDGLGPGTLIPQRGKLALERQKISPEEAFVLSRVDGHTSLEEICLLVPFEEPLTIVMLRRLWEIGIIEVPGVARTLVVPPAEKPASGEFQAAPASGLKRRPPEIEALAPPIATPPAAAAATASSNESSKLTDLQKQRIDDFFAGLDKRNAFELLEIDRSADDKAVKRAYFKLSKEFHPDRFYGREIGDDYKDRLSKIFQAVKAAFEVLSDKRRRAAYEESAGLK